jgi:hypothetical protein
MKRSRFGNRSPCVFAGYHVCFSYRDNEAAAKALIETLSG